MDTDGWPRVILLILLLLGAAYCASAEIAFASLSKIKTKNLADKGDKRAIKALQIVDNFDRTLTTLLIGNNITHIGQVRNPFIYNNSIFIKRSATEILCKIKS